jgi:hypothetical protein
MSGWAELRGDRRVDLRAVGDVAADGDGAVAQRADLLGRLLGVDEALSLRGLCERPVLVGALARLELDVREHDIGACPRQRQRVSPSDAARAPGDERDPSREIYLNRHAASKSRPGFAGARLKSGTGLLCVIARKVDLPRDDEPLDL